MLIKLSANEQYETNDFSLTQLKEFRMSLLERLDVINAKIETAKMNAALNKDYSDPDWWNRINFARKRYTRATQALMEEIAVRRRSDAEREKAERIGDNMRDQVPRHFLRFARQRLSRDLFEQILADAVDHYAMTQGGHTHEVLAFAKREYATDS